MWLENAYKIWKNNKKAIFTVVVTGILVYAAVVHRLVATYLPKLPIGVYFAATFILLLTIIDLLENIPRANNCFFSAQIEADGTLNEYLRDVHGKEAHIIAVSSSRMNQYIEMLLQNDCGIKLLMQHPRRTNDKKEQELITGTYHKSLDYAESIGKSNKLDVAFYDVPASIRGISIKGVVVAVGWYTYEKNGGDQNQTIRIMGFRNPFIVLSAKSRDGMMMQEFFDREFSKLWGKRLSPRNSRVGT